MISAQQENKKHCNLAEGADLQQNTPTFSKAIKLGMNVESSNQQAK